MNKFFMMALGLALATATAQAATISVTDLDDASGRVTSTGTAPFAPDHRHINVGSDDASIAIFALPTLGAGESITTANYNDYVGRVFSGTAPAVDLTAVRVSNSTTILGTDYSGGTLIQASIFDLASLGGVGTPPANPDVNTDAAGDAALAAWLQAQYTGSTPNATYAFLRLKGQTDTGGFTGYNLTNGNVAEKAQLTIESDTTGIPEPTTVALCLIAGLAIVSRRKA